MSKANVIADICLAISEGQTDLAAKIAKDQYPFTPGKPSSRRYTERQSISIFVRDGFIDRYSGRRLIFPGVLRLLSRLMPREFPAHKNWKMSESHIAYWELFPTIDHVVPVARGGVDEESNWVTASMLRNSAKSNWTLEELDWRLFEPGDTREWDGMSGWFLEYSARNSWIKGDPYLAKWYRALKSSDAGRA